MPTKGELTESIHQMRRTINWWAGVVFGTLFPFDGWWLAAPASLIVVAGIGWAIACYLRRLAPTRRVVHG
jgi:hypothetical protein